MLYYWHSGITGNVSIDENGDRNADYSLLDMDPRSGKFEVSPSFGADYDAKWLTA